MGGIDRLIAGFQKRNNCRYRIYYGPGIDDIYLNVRNQELKFDQAIYETLHELGYERIVFFSPHRSLFVYDEKSLKLSKGIAIDQKKSFDRGPLDDYQVLQEDIDQSMANHQNGMGDVHALRILDFLMKQENGPLTAVIFLQAEIGLKLFDDRRTLAGLVGEWAYLGTRNQNTCILVFAVNTFEALEEVMKDIPVPEIRKIVNREKEGLFFIKEASKTEIERALRLKAIDGYLIEEPNKLAEILAREGKSLRYWMNKLNELDAKNTKLSVHYAQSKGWIQAVVNPGESAIDQLHKLIGLETVKKRIGELIAWSQVSQKQNIVSKEQPTLHMIFCGNPGTGKTTVARLMGEIFHDLGRLKRGHLIEVQGGDLVAEYVGGTPAKVNSIIDQALDGVLFIDEAYSLTEKDRGGYGQEGLEILLSRMENERERLIVICAGYTEKMEQFRRSNPGLGRRFPQENILYFDDYGPDLLYEIFLSMLKNRNLVLSENMKPIIKEVINQIHLMKSDGFGNAGEIRNFVEGIERCRAFRIVRDEFALDSPILVEDIPETYQIYLPYAVVNDKKTLEELNGLIGLENVKDELVKLQQRIEFEMLRYKSGVSGAGKPRPRHFIFVGNPGTGKTTVGRIIGKLFKEIGLLGRGHVIEATRADLVASYIGQTAIKTREKIKSAIDGVLLIDEAYTLGNGDDFGQEAISELIKCMEDYQDRLVVIAAGYPESMKQFLDINPGLASRFGELIEFNNFTDEELWEIFQKFLQKENYLWEESIFENFVRYIDWIRLKDGDKFGNARSIMRLFDEVKSKAANRILEFIKSSGVEPSIDLLSRIVPEDIPEPGFYLRFESVPTTNAIAKSRV